MESNLTKRRIIQWLSEGKRFDKRGLLQYRNLLIEQGISKKAEGSARVLLGQTEVVAGVKLDIAEPFTDSPEEGVLIVTAELSPMASEKFEPGPPKIEAIEIARIVDRSIRESGFIDLKKLCIKKEEQVWAIFLDIYPINDAGNLIDTSVIAAVAALGDAVFPKVEKEKVKYGELTTKALPLTEKMPLTLTFHKLGRNFILDPVTEEEAASEARLSIALTQSKKEILINALQKGGDVLTKEQLFYVLDAAQDIWKGLYAEVKKKLK